MPINAGRGALALGTLGLSEGLNSAGVDLSGLPIIGGFFESPEQKALQEQYRQLQQAYQAYRPISQQAHMNALGNVLAPGLTGPINNQLAAMYGPGAQFDTSSLLRDPLGAAQAAQAQATNAAQTQKDAARPPSPIYGDTNLFEDVANFEQGLLHRVPGFSMLNLGPIHGPKRTTSRGGPVTDVTPKPEDVMPYTPAAPPRYTTTARRR